MVERVGGAAGALRRVVGMSQYERHVFVCEGKHCARAGGDDVRDAMKESVDRAGLKRRVRVNRAGCLGQCGHGPMVVVYPEGVWYTYVDTNDIDEIVESHLKHGKVVERLLTPPHLGR